MPRLSEAERATVRARLAEYAWYHRIRVSEDIYTTPSAEVRASLDEQPGGYQAIWDMILAGMDGIHFTDQRVLDVGCRDGLFCFEAERRGAREVVGIDNDLSRGAVEFLVPFFQSGVRFHCLNVYDLTPTTFGLFDVILCAGLLYHLRFPFLALKKLTDCLTDQGTILVEAHMLADPRYEEFEFLYCPVFRHPWDDPTSCTLFNKKGLCATLESFQCRLLAARALPAYGPGNGEFPVTNRQLLIFQKDESLEVGRQFLKDYWYGSHDWHSTQT
jgi:SAM-dependent methyltransferase